MSREPAFLHDRLDRFDRLTGCFRFFSTRRARANRFSRNRGQTGQPVKTLVMRSIGDSAIPTPLRRRYVAPPSRMIGVEEALAA